MTECSTAKRASSSVAVAMAALLLVGTACGTAEPSHRPERIIARDGRMSPAALADMTARIYAAVVRQLVLRDDTFGGPNPYFKRVFILERVTSKAGDPGSLSQPTKGKPLSAQVKQEMLKLLADLPPTEFVSRRGAVIGGKSANDPIGRVVHRGVLITLGPISGTHGGVQVPNNLWVSGLAGQWLTYVLEKTDAGWHIKGTAGPITIS